MKDKPQALVVFMKKFDHNYNYYVIYNLDCYSYLLQDDSFLVDPYCLSWKKFQLYSSLKDAENKKNELIKKENRKIKLQKII